MAVPSTASNVTAIVLLDAENYVKSNRHKTELVTQILAQPNVRSLVEQLVGATDAERAQVKRSLCNYVDQHSTAVKNLKANIRADLANPKDRLIKAALIGPYGGAEVRLAIIAEYSHNSRRIELDRAEKTRAYLRAAVADGWVTEEEFAAFSANVNFDTDLTDRPGTVPAVSAAPLDPAPVAPEPSDEAVVGAAANERAAAEAAAALAAAEKDAKRVLSIELEKESRKVLRKSRFGVTQVDGATADEVIAALSHKLRPGLVYVVSYDLDFYQLQRYGIIHVGKDGTRFTQYHEQTNDVFLLKCAVRGKGWNFINKWGPAFGPIPAGLYYPDAVNIGSTGTFECSPEYRERFEAFTRMTGDNETGEPWNKGTLAEVLGWLKEQEEYAPPDVRVRFLRNLCLPNIDTAHDVCVTPDDVITRIDDAVDNMISYRGWQAFLRSPSMTSNRAPQQDVASCGILLENFV